MNIRAKVRVSNVIKTGYSEQIQMHAVYSPDPKTENYSFSKSTPCLGLNMSIENPAAFGAFKEGQEFYLDFTPFNNPVPLAEPAQT